MDKETLSHYGWIVIVSLVLAVMIALATPFGVFVGKAVSNTVRGFAGTAQTDFENNDFDADQFELDYNKDKQEWEKAHGNKDETSGGKEVPAGGIYTSNGKALDTFPDTPSKNDTYEYGDYIYTYNGVTADKDAPVNSDDKTEWSVMTKDKTKSLYGTILSEIAGKPVVDMSDTFFNCASLTTSPEIPNSITNMTATFGNCTSLTVAPNIPSGVTNMSSTFAFCNSLTTVKSIPNSVTNMSNTFYNCGSLTGLIYVYANPTEYGNCFFDTIKSITLTGNQTGCNKLVSTTGNHNVKYSSGGSFTTPEKPTNPSKG